MKLRFISPSTHGIIDYSAAVALIGGPVLLNLGHSSPVAFWWSIIIGFAVIIVSTNTIYKYGIFNTLPYGGHLAIDLAAATTFLAAPIIFNFEGLDLYYYLVNAVVVYLVVALSASEPGTTAM